MLGHKWFDLNQLSFWVSILSYRTLHGTIHYTVQATCYSLQHALGMANHLNTGLR